MANLFGIPEQHMTNWGDALATPKSKSPPWSNTPEYHQWGAQDLTQEKSKEIADQYGNFAAGAFELAAPALALGASPIYDTAQAISRYKENPENYSSVWNAIDREDVLSAAYNRMIGAAKPTFSRMQSGLASIKNKFSGSAQSIDPTDKNLFTQHGYEEDDEYDFSGIEGQTAMINPFSIIGMIKAGLSKKQIAKVLIKNKVLKEGGKKVGPVITGVLTGGKAKGAPGGYTGPKTYDFDEGAHRRSGGNRPDKPGGFTDPGKGSYGPHMAYGGRASYFDGGLLSLWPR